MAEKDYHYTNQSPPPSSNGGEQEVVRTQAVFVNKLYKMLEDSSIQHLICWSENGDLFSVSNPGSFSKIVLPQYFKHNNWQSFVRQLNMYGFHKVNDMIHSNLNSDNQTWEFKHPHFKRGEIEDLQFIKRKSTKPNFSTSMKAIHTTTATATTATTATTTPQNSKSFENQPMINHISHIEDQLHNVLKSCELLRNESDSLRGLLSQQQKVIQEFVLLITDLVKDDGLNLNSSRKDTLLSKLTTLLSFQQEQYRSSLENYDYSLWGSNTPSPTNIPTNRLLGFGKESHLLNPAEPITDHKKRRIN